MDNTKGESGPRKTKIDQKPKKAKNALVNKHSNITCFYTNADSLLNKRAEFSTAIAHFAPDVICVNEVVPKHTLTKVQESEIQLEGYDLCSNLNYCKRGVAIFTAKRLNASPADRVKTEFEESCWVEIDLRGKDRLLVGCVYRSPNSDVINTAKLLSNLKSICAIKMYTHLLICGDFNFPEVNWKDDITLHEPNSVGLQFRECLRDCYLTQHVKEYTHRRGEQKPSTIDLILTNEENMIEDLSVEAPIGKSHHAVLLFSFICYTESSKQKVHKPLYSKGDYVKFRAKMEEYDWKNDFEGKTCEECWRLFVERMEKWMNEFIPRKCSNYGKPGRPLWINSTALEKVKKKTEAYKRYISTREGEDYLKYARARNQARWESRKAKKVFESKLAKESKHNPKAFYNYVNGKLKTRPGVSNLKTKEGTATTDEEKAEALNKFFMSVFTREDTSAVPSFELNKIINSPMEDLNVSFEEVKKQLEELNPTKSPGPDNMHPRILKELCPVISEPLAMIMTKSLNEGILPQSWKSANVSPIYKKGPKSDCGNYRPVSLTSVICKTLEAIIRRHIMKFVSVNKLLSECQHGFISGRSCSTQLLQCLEIWTEMLDNGLDLDAVYLDFAKAFDSVPHQRLLAKLSGLGLNKRLLKWSESFLTGRKQRVVVNGSSSSWADVLSGVPQGSVLGPLFFVIFINDMPDVVHNFIALFADDAKVFSSVSSVSDHEQLQQDLVKLQGWADTWQLNFNAKKCKVMHLGRLNPKYSYKMGETELEAITQEKDLGVIIDDELKFDIHIEGQVNKANRQLGLIRRSFDNLEDDTFINLYKSLARTHLEYCNAVSYPIFERQAKLLEGVQRRATKLVTRLEDLSYIDRLKALKLPSLYYRRARGDMIETYKYMHGVYEVNPCPLTLDENPASTRGHMYKLKKIRCNKSITQKFFKHRVVNLWNKLPEEVVTAPTLNTFKNRLDRHWSKLTYTLEPIVTIPGAK